jgi:succinyl-CoA synthetase beta subunit
MNLHEYQAKSLLKDFGIPLLKGQLAYTPLEAQKAASNLGGGVVVVKAQVHAGGRGKAGGVKLAKNPHEARELAAKIIGMKLVTPQTGAEGKLVRKVWVEEGCEIAKEYYVSLVVDRAKGSPAFIVSQEGGMEIEEVAHKDPSKILTVPVSVESGLQEFHLRLVSDFLKIEIAQQPKLHKVLKDLHKAFLQLDCDMLEINPLIVTKAGEFVCLDAKMALDDNALFRQPKAAAMLDLDEIDEREIRAGEVGINYVALDGKIGCMVNGAGLAMATMDIIAEAGGTPANFLDVGGGATKEMVTEAFKLILKDSKVKGVFVNIFGGIMRCDVIAEGIIEAAKELNIQVPVVVRLQGTNVDIGKKLLADSGLKLTPCDEMDEAAKTIVKLVA